MKGKFEIKDDRTLKEKIVYFLRGLIFWKGRPAKHGPVHTRNLEWGDFRYIFFPKNFADKYGYLGTSVWNEDSVYFKALYPLVLALDYEAKPKWCPRRFLRFLDVFGNDKSLVRVRNHKLSNLHRSLTKGIHFWDWKTKWSDYDLRISISGPKHLQHLANDIERGFYKRGREEELVNEIKKINPDARIMYGNISLLEKQLEQIRSFRRRIKVRPATNIVRHLFYFTYLNSQIPWYFGSFA